MAFAGMNHLAIPIATVAGFVFDAASYTTLAVNNAFGQCKASLTVIGGIHWLGVLVIQDAIIGAMGV
jgi:hypothetical protein